MRMWMVDPKFMCRKHLMGEHVELHMFVGTLNKGNQVKGYLRNNLLEPKSILDRHQALAEEMVSRGYHHTSNLATPSFDRLTMMEQDHRIDRKAAEETLLSRCKICRGIKQEKEFLKSS